MAYRASRTTGDDDDDDAVVVDVVEMEARLSVLEVSEWGCGLVDGTEEEVVKEEEEEEENERW